MATLCKRPDCGKPFQPGTFWAKYCSRACGTIVRSRRAYRKKYPICKEFQEPIEAVVDDMLCGHCRVAQEQLEPEA